MDAKSFEGEEATLLVTIEVCHQALLSLSSPMLLGAFIFG